MIFASYCLLEGNLDLLRSLTIESERGREGEKGREVSLNSRTSLSSLLTLHFPDCTDTVQQQTQKELHDHSIQAIYTHSHSIECLELEISFEWQLGCTLVLDHLPCQTTERGIRSWKDTNSRLPRVQTSLFISSKRLTQLLVNTLLNLKNRDLSHLYLVEFHYLDFEIQEKEEEDHQLQLVDFLLQLTINLLLLDLGNQAKKYYKL